MTDTHDNAPQQSRPTQERQNGPADVIRDGNLKATIWRNEGDKGVYFTTEFARTFKDAEGNLRDTHSFIGADQLKLGELARKSYDRTTELRREDFKRERAAREQSPRTRSERDR